jgi:O-antigen ligase
MPLSLAPEKTLSALLALLPAAAMFALLLRSPLEKPGHIALAAVLATFVSVLVSVMQLTQGSAWYPYSITSHGSAVGLFANSNHFAALILVSMPLMVSLVADLMNRSGKKRPHERLPGLVALGVGATIVLIAMVLNNSFAIFLLGGPIIAASALILLPPRRVRVGRLASLVVLTLAAGAAALATIGSDRLTRLAGQASVVERQQIWETSTQLALKYFPVGSGLGSFDGVYHLEERPDAVAREYVNHAHNDFLELIIELGLPGVLLIVAFLIWWLVQFVAIWSSSHSPPIARAATLVSLSLMLHSLVDFPLRPAALLALFASAIALMAKPVRVWRQEATVLPKHLKLEDLD